MKNPVPESPQPEEGGGFVRVRDGASLYRFVHGADPAAPATVYVLAGITGINHRAERDVIEALSARRYRVVVVHPRGTGYSSGKRGSLKHLDALVEDYVEVMGTDLDSGAKILFGHSMSCALSIRVAARIPRCAGVILVNPPVALKPSPGMTPSFLQYAKYAFFLMFARHVPVVDMGGDPSLIHNEEERAEAVSRRNDPLLVRWLSMNMMLQSRTMMNGMPLVASGIDVPLLLVYGTADSMVEESGCEALFASWAGTDKTYLRVPDGPHGKKTVLLAAETIAQWMASHED